MESSAAMKLQKFTLNDLNRWRNEGRCEMIHGEIYMMSPAPSSTHQSVVTNLTGQFVVYFQGKKCRVFATPYDVYLSKDTIVQPDLLVICNKNKIEKKGCFGAPDFVLEVLSPSTKTKDRYDKYKAYEVFGVREYWIIDPDKKTVETYMLSEKTQRFVKTGKHNHADKVKVGIFDDLIVNLADVFESPY